MCPGYFIGCEDDVVDGYGDNKKLVISSDADMGDAAFFEDGVGIGSGYFKLQLSKQLKSERQDPGIE